jgi:hypothetical protein
MHLGLGLTTPPDFIFKAEGEVWMVGGYPEQPIALLFCNA